MIPNWGMRSVTEEPLEEEYTEEPEEEISLVERLKAHEHTRKRECRERLQIAWQEFGAAHHYAIYHSLFSSTHPATTRCRNLALCSAIISTEPSETVRPLFIAFSRLAVLLTTSHSSHSRARNRSIASRNAILMSIRCKGCLADVCTGIDIRFASAGRLIRAA
jgi:hypothetical protein